MLFGLALAAQKTEGPSQVIEFLGIILDSLLEELRVSDERRTELHNMLEAFSKRSSASIRRVQQLLGKLSFAATVLPGAKIFLRRVIDSMAGRRCGQVQLRAPFKAELRYWRDHMACWNGKAKWRASAQEPLVFASDASTSGFAYGLESCPSALLETLPDGKRPGEVRAGTWSWSPGHAVAQQHSSAIQWGEFFCPLAAAAVEFAPQLRDQHHHVVFVIDNESDVHVINRSRTRDPELARLLRALCDTSLRYNFHYEAVHRRGVDNVLMDWASRPDLHRFSATYTTPARLETSAHVEIPVPAPPERLAVPCAQSVALPALSPSYPPLLLPTSLTYVSSRCLRFDNKASSAKCGGRHAVAGEALPEPLHSGLLAEDVCSGPEGVHCSVRGLRVRASPRYRGPTVSGGGLLRDGPHGHIG